MSEARFELSAIHYVKRIIVGSHDPTSLKSDTEIERSTELLNKCLSEYPRGTIIGMEKSFNILHVGEHQVVMQYLVYHIGFLRKPVWIE